LKQVVEPLAKRHRVQIDVEISGVPVRMPYAIEMNLLRIGQEALSNAVKHGHAAKIELVVHYDPENVKLSVADDGHGFVPGDHASSGHFGLLDMRERATSMGSELEIHSEPGQGTRVSVQVPISPQATADAELKANTYPGR
jgi:signal transduction histidine kinase